MRIAVISDLHIGAEDFRPDGFGAFLDHLECEHDEIILLGDVFECYFPVLPWGALADHDHFDRRYHDITDRFRSSKYTVLSGNHDIVAWRARGVPSRTERGGADFGSSSLTAMRTRPRSKARSGLVSSSCTCCSDTA